MTHTTTHDTRKHHSTQHTQTHDTHMQAHEYAIHQTHNTTPSQHHHLSSFPLFFSLISPFSLFLLGKRGKRKEKNKRKKKPHQRAKHKLVGPGSGTKCCGINGMGFPFGTPKS
eukprot:Phypoly_transcript_30655.p1 GENE.Phypoly_transcript_30655~~Phypoly_transcript_30655.p1  ORF type:complete len:113 (+),score=24.96 Phypoly_transcript_30655:3-341(+)